MNKKVRATVHGAVSIVNAIATGYGSALGISLRVTAEAAFSQGSGLKVQSEAGADLITKTVQAIVPNDVVSKYELTVTINSEIPYGCGLKSSSAVSNAVALACSKLLYDKVDEKMVLDAGVDGSIRAKVTRTGAYDDSTACYFGGFVVTDNRSRHIIRQEMAPNNLYSIILLPAYEVRKNIVDKLTLMSDLFRDAFNMALEGQYWKAMKLNGILMCAAYSLNSTPAFVALQSGALSCSISGNGPAIAAVTTHDEIDYIADAFSKFGGTTLISKINNEKASVEELVG